MDEMWRPVLGLEEYYMISDRGRCARIKTQGGRPTWRLLKYKAGELGYVRYILCVGNDRQNYCAHRTAWEAFNGKIPDNLQINHKNGVKDDNRLENLEVVTSSENNKHRYRVLLVSPSINPHPGSKNGRAKLTEADIPKIRKMLGIGISQTEVARSFGVNQTSISEIACGNTWRHVRQV